MRWLMGMFLVCFVTSNLFSQEVVLSPEQVKVIQDIIAVEEEEEDDSLISGPSQIGVGELGNFTPTEQSETAVSAWDVRPRGEFSVPMFEVVDSGNRLIVASGSVSAKFWIILSQYDESSLVLTVRLLTIGPNPNPNPNPKPEPQPEPKPKPYPEPSPSEPSEELRILVEPITSMITGDDAKKNGRELSYLYRDFAEYVSRDVNCEICPSTSHLRLLHMKAGGGMFQRTGMQGKYPGLSEKLNSVVSDYMGLDNKPVDNEIRKQIVDMFKALEWACWRAE